MKKLIVLGFMVGSVVCCSGYVQGSTDRKMAIGFQLIDLGLFKPSLISYTHWIRPGFALQPTIGYCNIGTKVSYSYPGYTGYDTVTSVVMYGVNGLFKIVEDENTNLYLGAGLSQLTIGTVSGNSSSSDPAMSYCGVVGTEWFLSGSPNLGFFIHFGYSWLDYTKDSRSNYYVYDPNSGYYVNRGMTVTNSFTAGSTNMSWGVHYYFNVLSMDKKVVELRKEDPSSGQGEDDIIKINIDTLEKQKAAAVEVEDYVAAGNIQNKINKLKNIGVK